MNKRLINTAIAAATMLVMVSNQTSAETVVPLTPVVTKPEAQQAAPAEVKTATTNTESVKKSEDFEKQVLLTVNGQPITGGMLEVYLAERMQKIPGANASPQMQNMVLNELINVALLSQVARKDHMDTRPEVIMGLDLQRDMLLSRMVLQEQSKAFTPSEQELKKTYDEQYATPRQEYKADHILVKTEEEAKAVITQLEKGTDFTILAKEKSMDSNANKGGDLGWFEASQMVKPFSDAAAAMKVGTFTHTPVQTQFGWHIIKLEDKRSPTPPTFDAVKTRISTDIQRKMLSEYVEKLRADAKIEVSKNHAATAEPTPIK